MQLVLKQPSMHFGVYGVDDVAMWLKTTFTMNTSFMVPQSIFHAHKDQLLWKTWKLETFEPRTRHFCNLLAMYHFLFMVFNHFFHCHLPHFFGCFMHHELWYPYIPQVFNVCKLASLNHHNRSLSFSTFEKATCGMETIPHLKMLKIFINCSLTNFTNASLWTFGTHDGSNMRKSKWNCSFVFCKIKNFLFISPLDKNYNS
jgi:hypothetical protein